MNNFEKNISRRSFLKLSVGSIAAASFSSCTFNSINGKVSNNSNKNNVVFILVDDLGWADVGCYGSTYHQTPNIDALARNGMKFTDAYAACAVCSPTRASVMTGRYPARIGVTDWIRFLPMHDPRLREKKVSPYKRKKGKKLACPRNPLWMELDELTLAEVLKTQGYATCHIGKWHLGPEKYWPDKQGFDHNIGGCDLGLPPTYFDPYYSDRFGLGYIETLPPRKKGEYLTDREADEAVKFIENNRDNPFFLYLSHYAVHKPIEAKEKLVKKYENKKGGKQDNPEYAAMVESVDQSVGKVVKTLEKNGLSENTLIIFTGDNGGLLPITNNAPLRKGKGYAYEGGIREPLIICQPGVVPEGTVSDEVVTSVDFFPTVLEYNGIELPKDREIDGVSLVEHLTSGGKKGLGRDAVYWHFPHYRHDDIVPYSIIRSGNWKLIKRYEGKTFELFNLEDDIGEKNDFSAEKPNIVKELNNKLENWLESVDAKLPMKI